MPIPSVAIAHTIDMREATIPTSSDVAVAADALREASDSKNPTAYARKKPSKITKSQSPWLTTTRILRRTPARHVRKNRQMRFKISSALSSFGNPFLRAAFKLFFEISQTILFLEPRALARDPPHFAYRKIGSARECDI